MSVFSLSICSLAPPATSRCVRNHADPYAWIVLHMAALLISIPSQAALWALSQAVCRSSTSSIDGSVISPLRSVHVYPGIRELPAGCTCGNQARRKTAVLRQRNPRGCVKTDSKRNILNLPGSGGSRSWGQNGVFLL